MPCYMNPLQRAKLSFKMLSTTCWNLQMIHLNIFESKRSINRLSLITKKPPANWVPNVCFPFISWNSLTTRCSSSFFNKSSSHYKWMLPTFEMLVVAFTFASQASSSRFSFISNGWFSLMHLLHTFDYVINIEAWGSIII